ncbi:MAG: sugar transferase [Paludibacteraceae bacterium]|nr:sugar transferase [Paludibacteraceae bacterium]
MGRRICGDIVIWLLATLICMLWRMAAHKSEIAIYLVMFGIMMVVYILLGFVFQKYRSYKETWYWQEMVAMLLTGSALICTLMWVLPHLPYSLSPVVILWMVVIVMIIDAFVILCKHYVKYALNMTIQPLQIEQREGSQLVYEDQPRSAESIENIHQAVLSLTTETDYQMLLNKAHLDSRLTKVVASTELFPIVQLPDYHYNTIVDLTLLNNARGINRRFCQVNKKLPDEGIYVCCYRPQEFVKRKIMTRYPWGINYLAYACWFVFRRVIPRMLLMSRLYYDVTKGRKRVLSKTEVLGRLYYCGFEVDEVVPMGHIEYVIAHRHSQPYEQVQMKLYGPLIRLPRVCKDKNIVYFYKLRTMHPYSEYIQKYVFDQRGGMNIADKSDEDWRITNWGRLFRKYWLDELPMLINWLKRDVKLVGVRPLSKTMFDQYPPDLQDKRTRCKPGLIPPFYVDHPKNFEELYASEHKYLDEYFRHPVWTDIKYFFMTMHSILFKKMHSA